MTPKKDWKEALCYSTPIYKEHEVNGRKQRFYAVSPHLLFKLRTMGIGIVKSVSELFVSAKNDFKTVDSQSGTDRTVVLEPISIEMAKYRDKQRADGWAAVIEALTDPETLNLVADIVMDSLVEVFPKDEHGNRTGPSVEEFLRETKLPTLSQMVVGTAKGNADVFGPLAEKVTSLVSGLGNLATTKLNEANQVTVQEPAPQAPPLT